VLTGGFGAEFGRSIGGVVNIITKSGSNDWVAGGRVAWAPNSLRATQRDILYPVTGKPEGASTDGTMYRRYSDREVDRKTVGVYAGGPLIENRLFAFVAAEQERTGLGETRIPTSGTAQDRWGWRDADDATTRYVGKFDWNLSDDHRLELTLIGDKNTRKEELRGYDYATGAKGSSVNTRLNYRDYDGVTPIGADVQILKYTGNLSENLTLTASHGRSQSKHELGSPDFNVFDSLSGISPVSAPARVVPPGLTIRNNSPFLTTDSIAPEGARDEVTASRLDIEWRLGAHSLRGGLDKNRIEAVKNGRIRPGDGLWFYLRSSQDPTVPIAMSVGAPVAPASGGGFGTQGYYVLQSRFTTTTDASSDQDAVYLEDKWQFGKDLLLTAGLRNESFKHHNGDGQQFLHIKNQLQPRLAAAWDVNGDASLKLFGSAGRYAVQTPNQVTERHGSRSYNTRQYFTYTGVDAATGAPDRTHGADRPALTQQRTGTGPRPQCVGGQRPQTQLPGRTDAGHREGDVQEPQRGRAPDPPQAAQRHRRRLRDPHVRELGGAQQRHRIGPLPQHLLLRDLQPRPRQPLPHGPGGPGRLPRHHAEQ
jgi:hypothetical protein